MIRLKKTIIQLDSIDKEIAESNIRSRITKKLTLSLTNTSAWVISPERLFIGKENSDGSISIARYREPIFKLFPKIYTKWSIQQKEQKINLLLNHRVSTFTILGCLLFFLNISQLASKSLTLVLLFIIILIARYLLIKEIKINEEILHKIVYERIEDNATL